MRKMICAMIALLMLLACLPAMAEEASGDGGAVRPELTETASTALNRGTELLMPRTLSTSGKKKQLSSLWSRENLSQLTRALQSRNSF